LLHYNLPYIYVDRDIIQQYVENAIYTSNVLFDIIEVRIALFRCAETRGNHYYSRTPKECNYQVRKPILISGFRCHIAKNYLYEVILT